MNLASQGNASFVITDGVDQEVWIHSALKLQLNKWYNIVGTYDGHLMVLYIDGVMDKDNTAQTTISIGTNNMSVGIGSGLGEGGSEGEFQGLIDDVRIYHQSLTQAQVKQLYAEGLNNLNLSQASLKE